MRIHTHRHTKKLEFSIELMHDELQIRFHDEQDVTLSLFTGNSTGVIKITPSSWGPFIPSTEFPLVYAPPMSKYSITFGGPKISTTSDGVTTYLTQVVESLSCRKKPLTTRITSIIHKNTSINTYVPFKQISNTLNVPPSFSWSRCRVKWHRGSSSMVPII